MATMAELLQLIQQDIPEGRRHLYESHGNLEKVAQYCEGNYLQAKDKRYALEETKNYTTQSLASVAYQINTLATSFLHLLDIQMNQMAEMESSINHLSETVMIHKEKVARREIGVLTTNKTTTKPPGVKNPGIVFPDQPERPIKYVRRPIDYSCLDEIGHGVKVQSSNPRLRRTSSASSSGKMSATSAGSAPTTRPPTPPQQNRAGTLGRNAGSMYRAMAPPVTPPSLPSHYAHGHYAEQQRLQQQQQQQMQQQQQHYQAQQQQMQQQQQQSPRRGNYAPLGNVAQVTPVVVPQAPPMGMVHPMAQQQPPRMSEPTPAPPTPPPPPPMPQQQSTESYEPPPPPPLSPSYDHHSNPRASSGNVSPPLPPPPEHEGDYDDYQPPPPPAFIQPPSGYHQNELPEEYQVYSQGQMQQELTTRMEPRGEPEWIPKEYIEKVIAIYDYTKDKDDELTFQENAIIYVIKKNDDGWWEGVMENQTGLFPGNYVEPCI